MKLLRVEKTPHPESWRQVYRRNPRLADASYDTQLAAWTAHAVQGAGAMQRALGPLGYDVHEVYSDIEPLQRAWAREHGVHFPPIGWTQAIPLAQARALRPDMLYSYDARNLDYAWLDRLRREVSSVRVVCGFIGSSSFDVETFRHYDFLLTCTQEYGAYFTQRGIRTVVTPHVVDARIVAQLVKQLGARTDHSAMQHALVFTGSLWRDVNGHTERAAVLEALADMPELAIYSPQALLTPSRDLLDTTARRSVFALHQALTLARVPVAARRALPIVGKGATWTAWPVPQRHPQLHGRAQAPVFGLDMFRLLRNARACLNCVEHTEAANMRLFEATGVGTCLLTSHRDNLPSLFDVDTEVVTYRSPAEAREKARWLLEHPRDAESIAVAGQRRTLRDYTWTHRAALLDELVRAQLARAQTAHRGTR